MTLQKRFALWLILANRLFTIIFKVYLKFKASQIFDGTKFLPHHSVLITNSKGIVVDIVDESIAGENVQHFAGIICPGFINAHCHLELSFLKNKIPQHTGMVGFIEQILQKRNANIEIIEQAIVDAENEMISNGIVAVGDICNTTHTLFQKLKGKLYYHNFIEISGFVPNSATERFNAGAEVYHQFKKHFQNNTTIVPHAPYSVSQNLLSLIDTFQQEYITTIHNQESIDEQLFFTKKEGAFLELYKNLGVDISFFTKQYYSSIEHYLPLFKNVKQAILVHNTFTQKNDINLINSNPRMQFYYCLCVIANKYITKNIPNIGLFDKNVVVVGTDSLASNFQLNILKELQTIYNTNHNLSIENILQFATLNGAKALGVENKLGSFEKNKQPKVLLINNLITDKKPIVLV